MLLITGASRGIGAATAVQAAARGYFVCVNSRQSVEAATSVVKEIRERGGNGVAVQADVGQEADVARLFETVDAQGGSLAGVVNNAGEVAPASRLEDMDSARWEAIFRTHVLGTLYCTK